MFDVYDDAAAAFCSFLALFYKTRQKNGSEEPEMNIQNQ